MTQTLISSIPSLATLPPQGSVFAQLGRAGDILNILPILDRIGGGSILCRPEFAGIFERVSYAKMIPWTGHVDLVMLAAQKHRAIVTQCFGDAAPLNRKADNFAVEEWIKAGVPPREGFGTLNLDRRDESAETALVEKYIHGAKPVILVNAAGMSSPYPHRPMLEASLAKWKNQCQILDLSSIRAESICDLLGLYDRAMCLVTVDTATLHLAAASKVPVCYIKPRGWVASPPKGQCVHEQYFEETDFTTIDRIIDYLLHNDLDHDPEVWYAIPSCNTEKCGETFAMWRAMGYKTAVLVDGDVEAPTNAELVLRTEKYPGYAASVNMLCQRILEVSAADIVVTGGDDIYPDTQRNAFDLGRQFCRHFRGTLGVMQPWSLWDNGIDGGEKGSAVSPWLGREWITRAYNGKGPLPSCFYHYYTDTELREVAQKHGLYWENRQAEQFHANWGRKLPHDGQAHRRHHPEYLDHAFAHFDEDYRLMLARRSAGFPGSEVIGHTQAAAIDEKPEQVVIAGVVFWKHARNLYPDYLNHGDAKSFIEHVALKYCQGTGIDVGAGQWPFSTATAVRDEPHQNAYRLDMIPESSLDYVFSSHCIEHLKDPRAAFELWARKLKMGGKIFIYAPHPAMSLWAPGAAWCGNGHVWAPSLDRVCDMLASVRCPVAKENQFAGPDAYWSFWCCGVKQ